LRLHLTKAQAQRQREIRKVLKMLVGGLAFDVIEDALWRLYPGFNLYGALGALFKEAIAISTPGA
jgi:hypothetical protein